MGCFDFTYADNGSNIRGGRGYIYTTKEFQKRTNTKSPLRFTGTNEYGDFFVEVVPHVFALLDIYALLALQYYLQYLNGSVTASEKLTEYEMISMDVSIKETGYIEACEWLLDALLTRNNLTEFCFPEYQDTIRFTGVHLWFDSFSKENITCTVPALGNQRMKLIETECVGKHTIPLLITRKKLHNTKDKDLSEIAKQWGFVSCEDPEQGGRPLVNHYCKYVGGGIVKRKPPNTLWEM